MFWKLLQIGAQSGIISQILVKATDGHSSSHHLPSPTPALQRIREVAPASRSPTVGESADTLDRPGCQIADACVLVSGYLEELSMGMGGYGVLKLGLQRLEEAARMADRIHRREMAEEIREIAEKIPAVHTPEAAAELAEVMRPVKERAWRLGRACGLAHK